MILQNRKKAILFGLGFFIIGQLAFLIPGWAEKPIISKGKISFTIDTANFWQDPEKSYLEVYYKIPHSELHFFKRDNTYKAKFDLSIVLYDQRGAQVTGDRWEQLVVIDDLSEASISYSYSQIRFLVEPDEYKIKIKLEDLHNKKKGTAETNVNIKPFPASQFDLGQIQFSENIIVDSTESAYTKHQFLHITPNTTRTFGENQTDFYFYTELYSNIENFGLYQIQYQLIDSKDSVMISRQETLEVNKPVTPYVGSEDIAKFEQEPYKLILIAENLASNDSVSTKKEFSVIWSPVAWGTDYQETFNQILYIATSEELKAFKKLKEAPEKERTEFMVEFWAKRDPVPRTPQNEFMIEHYRRFKYVNEAFGSAIPGWRTDMGRIFIKFGEPDEIERQPFSFNSRPYEIWHYYQCGYRFVFVDETGYGRYNLVSPSSEEAFTTDCR